MLKLALMSAMALALLLVPQESARKQEGAGKGQDTAAAKQDEHKKAGDDKKNDDPLAGVKCCMMPKRDIKKEQAVAYRDGHVYFCCPKCKGSFEKDTAKFAEKANHQLVQTKQYVQTSCPISGEKVDDSQMLKVGEIEVKFCCENCLKKVKDAADDEAKLKLVFADSAFEKAFAKAEASSGDKAKGKEDKKSDAAPAKKKAG
jgi:uncharacterized C2H2 Zn-finger protein